MSNLDHIKTNRDAAVAASRQALGVLDAERSRMADTIARVRAHVTRATTHTAIARDAESYPDTDAPAKTPCIGQRYDAAIDAYLVVNKNVFTSLSDTLRQFDRLEKELTHVISMVNGVYAPMSKPAPVLKGDNDE